MEFLDRARKCVVFIGGESEIGQFIPYGTGFLISIFLDEIQFDYIVTCHHVINIAKEKIWIRVNTKDGKSKTIETAKSMWLIDGKNDIAILSHYFSIDIYDVTRITEIDFAILTEIKDPDIFAGEETFLVGLFTSHYGDIHNMPIIRMGSIAAIPDEYIYTGPDTGYVKAYLLESRSIGGLSGSPVFLYHRFSDKGLPYPLPEDLLESYFLGMMRGRLIAKEKTDVVTGESEADMINTGIGIVIPAEIILKNINQPAFLSQREDTVKELKRKNLFRPTAAIPDTENPQHKEDFNSLVSAATKKKPQDD